jgi:hypothetical protein
MYGAIVWLKIDLYETPIVKVSSSKLSIAAHLVGRLGFERMGSDLRFSTDARRLEFNIIIKL